MKSLRSRSALANVVFAAVLSLTVCGKSADIPTSKLGAAIGAGVGGTPTSTAPGIAAAVGAAPAAGNAALLAAAPRLGFISKLPADTEMYFGSVNFKAQMDALKKSAFWKEISSLLDDKTPAPAAGDKSMVALQKLWGDDWFIAGSAGMTGFMSWIKDFNHLYNEMNFRTMMTGATGGKPIGGASGMEAMGGKFFQTLLQDPQQLERAQKIISNFDLPPILIGFKVDHPAEFARQLLPDDLLKMLPAEVFTLGTMTTPSGAVFRTLTAEGSRILSARQKEDILTKLPDTLPGNAKQAIEKALSSFQTKKFSVGWGAVGDYLIFAMGKNLDHVKFAATPGESLLSRPELTYLTPLIGKNLFAISHFATNVLSASADEQPFTPLLRGLVSGLKESTVFRDLANTLDKQLDELSQREIAVFHRDYTAITSALWWDRGVHMESYGGAQARVYQTGKPLQYARLLDQPGVVVGWTYVRNKEYEKAERAWSEQLISSLYAGAQELVKAGFGGPEVSQKFAMFDQIGAPLLLKIYRAKLDLSEKGLDGETAGILDINGKMPALPNLPPEANGMKIPRLTSVSQVSNRAEIGIAWKTINETLVQAVTAVGGGQVPMMEPISSDKNGVTSYFYAIPFLSGDLLPCSSVNDHVFMLSTSKDAAETIAAELAKPPTGTMDGSTWHANHATLDGLVWRVDPGLFMEYLVTVSKLAPNQKPGADKEIRQILKWAKPFHAMQARLYQEGVVPRTSFTWEITDLISFD